MSIRLMVLGIGLLAAAGAHGQAARFERDTVHRREAFRQAVARQDSAIAAAQRHRAPIIGGAVGGLLGVITGFWIGREFITPTVCPASMPDCGDDPPHGVGAAIVGGAVGVTVGVAVGAYVGWRK